MAANVLFYGNNNCFPSIDMIHSSFSFLCKQCFLYNLYWYTKSKSQFSLSASSTNEVIPLCKATSANSRRLTLARLLWTAINAVSFRCAAQKRERGDTCTVSYSSTRDWLDVLERNCGAAFHCPVQTSLVSCCCSKV